MSLEGKSAEEIEALATLAQNLASNPKTRGGFLQLTKQANPDTSIPEVDIPNRISALLEPHLKTLNDLKTREAERDLRDRVEAARKEAGIPASELAAVEKVMVDNRIADHKTAKQFMDLQSKAAEPTPAATTHAVRRFGAPKMPDLTTTGGDLKAWSFQKAHEVIDELHGIKRTAA